MVYTRRIQVMKYDGSNHQSKGLLIENPKAWNWKKNRQVRLFKTAIISNLFKINNWMRIPNC